MTQILPRKAADNKLRELVKAKLNHVVQNLDMHAISLCGPVAKWTWAGFDERYDLNRDAFFNEALGDTRFRRRKSGDDLMASKRFFIILLCVVLGLVAAVATVGIVVGMTRDSRGILTVPPPIEALILVPVACVGWTMVFLALAPLRNLSRIDALRRAHPGATVMGAHILPQTLDKLAHLGGGIEAVGQNYGQLWTLMADAEGISIWRGKASDLQRRAFIPWGETAGVRPGRMTYARESESVRVLLREDYPQDFHVDFVPTRKGILGFTTILSIARVGAIAKSMGEIRAAALVEEAQSE